MKVEEPIPGGVIDDAALNADKEEGAHQENEKKKPCEMMREELMNAFEELLQKELTGSNMYDVDNFKASVMIKLSKKMRVAGWTKMEIERFKEMAETRGFRPMVWKILQRDWMCGLKYAGTGISKEEFNKMLIVEDYAEMTKWKKMTTDRWNKVQEKYKMLMEKRLWRKNWFAKICMEQRMPIELMTDENKYGEYWATLTEEKAVKEGMKKEDFKNYKQDFEVTTAEAKRGVKGHVWSKMVNLTSDEQKVMATWGTAISAYAVDEKLKNVDSKTMMQNMEFLSEVHKESERRKAVWKACTKVAVRTFSGLDDGDCTEGVDYTNFVDWKAAEANYGGNSNVIKELTEGRAESLKQVSLVHAMNYLLNKEVDVMIDLMCEFPQAWLDDDKEAQNMMWDTWTTRNVGKPGPGEEKVECIPTRGHSNTVYKETLIESMQTMAMEAWGHRVARMLFMGDESKLTPSDKKKKQLGLSWLQKKWRDDIWRFMTIAPETARQHMMDQIDEKKLRKTVTEMINAAGEDKNLEGNEWMKKVNEEHFEITKLKTYRWPTVSTFQMDLNNDYSGAVKQLVNRGATMNPSKAERMGNCGLEIMANKLNAEIPMKMYGIKNEGDLPKCMTDGADVYQHVAGGTLQARQNVGKVLAVMGDTAWTKLMVQPNGGNTASWTMKIAQDWIPQYLDEVNVMRLGPSDETGYTNGKLKKLDWLEDGSPEDEYIRERFKQMQKEAMPSQLDSHQPEGHWKEALRLITTERMWLESKLREGLEENVHLQALTWRLMTEQADRATQEKNGFLEYVRKDLSDRLTVPWCENIAPMWMIGATMIGRIYKFKNGMVNVVPSGVMKRVDTAWTVFENTLDMKMYKNGKIEWFSIKNMHDKEKYADEFAKNWSDPEGKPMRVMNGQPWMIRIMQYGQSRMIVKLGEPIEWKCIKDLEKQAKIHEEKERNTPQEFVKEPNFGLFNTFEKKSDGSVEWFELNKMNKFEGDTYHEKAQDSKVENSMKDTVAALMIVENEKITRLQWCEKHNGYAEWIPQGEQWLNKRYVLKGPYLVTEERGSPAESFVQTGRTVLGAKIGNESTFEGVAG